MRAEYGLLANVIVAGEDATFNDLPTLPAVSSRVTGCSRSGATSLARAALLDPQPIIGENTPDPPE